MQLLMINVVIYSNCMAICTIVRYVHYNLRYLERLTAMRIESEDRVLGVDVKRS